MSKGWHKRLSTIEEIGAERAAHPSATNTGLRTGRLVGVDIDIVPAEHVQAIKRLAEEVLGPALLERVGAKGAMLGYRNETPIGKITISGKHPTQAGKVEILGTGQQFVAYGRHPDTGKPYTWTNALLQGEPLHTPLDQLPEVTPERLGEFAERAKELLATLGYTDVKVSGWGRAVEPARLDAPADLDFDASINIERARTWLRSLIERGDVGVEGQQGDTRTYQVACRLRDFGLSPQAALDLLLEPDGWNEHCRPPWGHNELAVKVRNAYKYAKNVSGADAVSFPQVELDQLEVPGAATSTPANKLVERFRGRWPDEYEALPELRFWDEDNTLPRCPDGCIAIMYGEFGSHKTNTVLAMVLDAVLEESARVCYAAGEGAHGVGKHRIPAHCRARGITTRDRPLAVEAECLRSVVTHAIEPDLRVGDFGARAGLALTVGEGYPLNVLDVLQQGLEIFADLRPLLDCEVAELGPIMRVTHRVSPSCGAELLHPRGAFTSTTPRAPSTAAEGACG